MKALFVFEKFKEESDPIHDMGIGIDYDFLMGLLKKRVKYLENHNKINKKLGYPLYEYNIRIDDTEILFDAYFGTDIPDCKFKIRENTIIFTVTGTEGSDDLRFNVNERSDNMLKVIKKHARDLDCGGLK